MLALRHTFHVPVNTESATASAKRTKFENCLKISGSHARAHAWKLKKGTGTKKSKQQSALTQFITPEDVYALDKRPRDEASESARRDAFLQEQYDGFNVFTPHGLVAWLNNSLLQLSRPEKPPSTGLEKDLSDIVSSLVDTEKEELLSRDAGRHQEREDAAGVLRGNSEDSQQARHQRELQRLLTGSKGLEGPGVDICLELLEMKQAKQHRDYIWMYTSELLPEVRLPLLASQVTGIVHMLLRSCGEFPLSAKQRQEPGKYNPIVKRLAQSYPAPQTFGGLVEDAPGMGKTAMALGFFSWWAKHAKHEKNGRPHHAPSLLLVPDGYVLNQWVDLINRSFPFINLVLVKSEQHQEDDSDDAILSRWQQVQPRDFDNRDWPHALGFLDDTQQSKNSSFLFICSYSTWRRHVVKSESPTELDLSADQIAEDIVWQKSKSTGKAERKRFTVPHWSGRFAMTIFDEGHVTRNPNTQLHWMARKMRSPINWFLTATPIVDASTDKAGLGKVLWQQAKESLMHHTDWNAVQSDDKLEESYAAKWEIWREDIVTQTALDSPVRLIQLDPYIYQDLVKSTSLSVISRYAALYDKLATLRRSTHSELPGSAGHGNKAGKLDLTRMMRGHQAITTKLRHKPGVERGIFLGYHRMATKHHAEIIKLHMAKSGGGKKKSSDQQDTPPPVMGAFREMAYSTASTRLAGLAWHVEHALHTDTSADTVQHWRNESLSADNFLRLTNTKIGQQAPDPSRLSRVECLHLLSFGSPKLREILQQIRLYVLPRPGEPRCFKKLLITEEYPLVAWYWELVLNFLHIPTQVLHSSLDDSERMWVINQFREKPMSNDFHHLSVCILMHTFNASGVSLESDCNRCVVSTAASSAALEFQAWSRIIRGFQRNQVTIVRLYVENSHDGWREAVQANKAIRDSATKVLGGDGKQAIMQLLNDPAHGGAEITRIRNSPLAKKICARYLKRGEKRLLDSDTGKRTRLDRFLEDVFGMRDATAKNRAWETLWKAGFSDSPKAKSDQSTIYTAYICTLNSAHVYTTDELDNPTGFTLERALRL